MTSPPATGAQGSWAVPGSSFSVTYSLAVLQEIEFAVNEGYRKIPHGGIEVGGLLFGRLENKATFIEAFRLIDCEHARGPSFVLSERDLDGLRQQLAEAGKDPELEDLRPVGWFIAHTRGPLQMTEQEYGLFEQLFPAPGGITLLAKPERFKPTRFAFLVRDSTRQMNRDGTRDTFILPSPGRPARAPETAARSAERPEPAAVTPEPVIEQPQEMLPPPLVPALAPVEVKKPAVERELPAPPAPVPHVPRPETKPIQAPENKPAPPPEVKPLPISAPEPSPPFVPQSSPPAAPAVEASALPSMEEIRRRRSENQRGTSPAPSAEPQQPASRIFGSLAPPDFTDVRSAHQQITRKMRDESNRSRLVWAATLVIAAVLGSGVGYWAYLQLRAANIPLSLQAVSAGLVVSWPPEETRDAVYAAVQVDEAAAIPLSIEEKTAGRVLIKGAGDNTRIELIVQHWMANSEGIIRYVKGASPPAAPVVPAVTPKRRPHKQH
jgi:hypothetical protein